MATFSFTRLASGTIKVVADGNTFFLPGGCRIDPNDTYNRIIIYSSFGDKIQMDSALDTINIAGVPNTGTATEISEDLASDIFFLASSGGAEGAAILAAATNTFTGDRLSVEQDQASLIEIYTYNGDAEGASGISAYSVGPNVSMISYCPDHATPTRAGKVVIEAVNNTNGMDIYSDTDIKFILNGLDALIIPVGGIAAYADDAAAAIGGVPVKGLYRTASALKIRVA